MLVKKEKAIFQEGFCLKLGLYFSFFLHASVIPEPELLANNSTQPTKPEGIYYWTGTVYCRVERKVKAHKAFPVQTRSHWILQTIIKSLTGSTVKIYHSIVKKLQKLAHKTIEVYFLTGHK